MFCFSILWDHGWLWHGSQVLGSSWGRLQCSWGNGPNPVSDTKDMTPFSRPEYYFYICNCWGLFFFLLPLHCLVSENTSSATSLYVLISVYSQKIPKLYSSSQSLLALPRASWQVTQLSLPTEPLCWKNLVSSWRPRVTTLKSLSLSPTLMPPSTRYPLRILRWAVVLAPVLWFLAWF